MKKPIIINVRGNSGSGKTFLTREFIKLATYVNGTEPDQTFIYQKKEWAVLGKYGNVCGGCDTIKTQQEIIDRVENYATQGINVWLEGLILSTLYGSVGAYSEKFGDRWIFAYLMTPLDVCLRRIYERRKEAGNTKPLNETNTRNRVRAIEGSRLRCIDEGRRVVDLDWHKPLPRLLTIIRKEAR